MPLVPVNAASVVAATKPWPMESSLIELGAAFCTLIVRLYSQVMMLLNSIHPPYFIQQRRSRASEHRCHCSSRVCVGAHSPLCSGLDAASAAAGWWISAGVPRQPLTFRSWFQLVFLPRKYPAFGLHPRFSRKGQKHACSFRFCFPRLDGP